MCSCFSLFIDVFVTSVNNLQKNLDSGKFSSSNSLDASIRNIHVLWYKGFDPISILFTSLQDTSSKCKNVIFLSGKRTRSLWLKDASKQRAKLRKSSVAPFKIFLGYSKRLVYLPHTHKPIVRLREWSSVALSMEGINFEITIDI